MSEPTQPTTIVPELSLAGILNILWRQWRVLILFPAVGLLVGLVYGMMVTPLYVANASIRPGMTAFGGRGGADREWALKDLTRFYGAGFYREGVAVRMGIANWEVPRIRADFISKGLQNIQGGNVVTLSVLDPDPARAKLVLDAAIGAFADYAMADSVSNSLHLTKAGLEIQILERERRIAESDSKADVLRTEIQFAVEESLQIDTQKEMMRLDLRLFETRGLNLEAQLASVTREANNLRQRIDELEPTLVVARERARTAGSVAAPEGVSPRAVLSDAETYRALLSTSVDLDSRLQAALARADEVKREIASQEFEVKKRHQEIERTIALARAEKGQLLSKKRVDLNLGIPLERRAIYNEIRERRAQLTALSPVERVGHITASQGPVRPRKRRAATILFLLGGIVGLAAAFSWEFVTANRAEIIRRR